ncbi:MAG: phytanoyl-CoA dioxygenase family protein [Halioglobus sp.]
MLERLKKLLRINRLAAEASAVEAPVVSQSAQENGVSADAMRDILTWREARHTAAIEKGGDAGRAQWPPVYADPLPDMRQTIPEIEPEQLDAAMLGGAVAHHGALIIRGLLSSAQVADIRELQNEVRLHSDRGWPFKSPWYQPYEGNSKFEWQLRNRTQRRGGNWLADSPLGMQHVLEHLQSVGVVDAIAEHLGEEPAISLQKSTLRSVAPSKDNAGWHQDGSFLGDDVRTMNIWVSLSDCGGSTPASGLEIIPHRFESTLEIDSENGRASLPTPLVDELLQKYSSVVPQFAPGDAVMFDEKLVHRTAIGEHLSQERYALESWFFAPSHTAPTYVPFMAR